LENENTAEYFVVEEKTNEMVYARPIELTADCLVCHGDPATSASKNGKDLLGFRMEGWHAGDIHGAFVLRAKLDRVDAVVKGGNDAGAVLDPAIVAVHWRGRLLVDGAHQPADGGDDSLDFSRIGADEGSDCSSFGG
jgi:hypothetical protein